MVVSKINDHIRLAVRDLVRIAHRPRKSLSTFPLPQRGKLGKQAQALVQAKDRASALFFQKEVALHYQFEYRKMRITIQGRIDSVYKSDKSLIVEEIKSIALHRSEFNNLDINNYPEYIEQLFFYCLLLSTQNENVQIVPNLIMINLVDQKSKSFWPDFIRSETELLLRQRCDLIIKNLRLKEQSALKRRDQINRIRFPHSEQRPQQQEIIAAIKNTLSNHQHLLLSAPTGSGKTSAALFPSLQFALARQKRILYLTAKNTQQAVVLQTLQSILSDDTQINIVFLRASRSMCANDILFCHQDYCPYIKNYNDDQKRNNLIKSLIRRRFIQADDIYQQSSFHSICPAEIMFDLADQADIIVGDYNYLFDPRSMIQRLFQTDNLNEWILIIDEAHNLYARITSTLSPSLSRRNIRNLLSQQANHRLKVFRQLKSALQNIDQQMERLHETGEVYHSGQRFYRIDSDRTRWEELFNDFETAYIQYLLFKIRKRIYLLDDPYQEFYYQLRSLISVMNIAGPEYVHYFDAAEKGTFSLQCCDPSATLSHTINKFHTVIAMSATLDPIHYYQKVLGFQSQRTDILEVSSPFTTRNRKIIILPDFSTIYRRRSQYYPAYAEIIKKTIALQQGNYLVFAPSFEFIQNLMLFLGDLPCEILTQTPRMSGQQRDDILHSLRDRSNPKVLVAVMGGIFAEGIDLKGKSVIGAIIFGPALPKMTYQRDLIRDYYEQTCGEGFSYAYLYPGINKVIQSAGRLIRSAQDRGIIVMVGERFTDDHINQMFPSYWFEQAGDVVITEDYQAVIRDFWGENKKKG